MRAWDRIHWATLATSHPNERGSQALTAHSRRESQSLGRQARKFRPHNTLSMTLHHKAPPWPSAAPRGEIEESDSSGEGREYADEDD